MSFNADKIISSIVALRNSDASSPSWDATEAISLATHVGQLFESEPTLLEIKGPVTVIGEIHGQLDDLLAILDRFGMPPDRNYLFLGDLIDRGSQSVECTLLAYALKAKFPSNVHIVRGNHACDQVSRMYGFFDECKEKLTEAVWSSFIDSFDRLPLAAIINGNVLAVHGGLSPDLESRDDIRAIERPVSVPESGLITDLLWSDPDPDVQGWAVSPRGASFTFGPDVIRQQAKALGVKLIVRSHQLVDAGSAWTADKLMLTIFSAARYCGSCKNGSAIVHIDAESQADVVQMKAPE